MPIGSAQSGLISRAVATSGLCLQRVEAQEKSYVLVERKKMKVILDNQEIATPE